MNRRETQIRSLILQMIGDLAEMKHVASEMAGSLDRIEARMPATKAATRDIRADLSAISFDLDHIKGRLGIV